MKKVAIFALVLILTENPATLAQPFDTKKDSAAKTNNLKDNDVINASDFGVKCDGVTNDVEKINASITTGKNNGGATIMLPAGTCIVGGRPIVLASNIHLRGQKHGGTILTFSSAYNGFAILAEGPLKNISVSNLTIDGKNYIQSTMNSSYIFANGKADNALTSFYVHDVAIKNMGIFGIGIQGVKYFRINNNYFEKTAAASDDNSSIIATAVYDNSYGEIRNNVSIRTAFDLTVSHTLIEKNKITDWKFGGGIYLSKNTRTTDNIVINNTTSGGLGIDSNRSILNGLEIWGTKTIIMNNISSNNAGAGIFSYGKNNVIANNVVYDNGKYDGSYPGITCGYFDATYNCSGSTIFGNTSFNTRGSRGSQKYAYDQGTKATNITLGTNNFSTGWSGIVGPSVKY